MTGTFAWVAKLWRTARQIMTWPGAALSDYMLTRMLGSRAAEVDPNSYPSVGLRPGERAMWSGTMNNLLLWIAGLGLGTWSTVSAIEAWTSGHASFLSLFAGPFLASPFIAAAGVRVNIAPSGVEIRAWPLPWTRRSIPLSRIEAANVINVKPLHWGGWGRHWLGTRRTTAFVTRAGSAIQLLLDDGNRVVVTVSDANAAAGLVNDLVRVQSTA